MEEKIIQLKKITQELLDFKRGLEIQQVQSPLGKLSKKIIQKDMLVSTGQFGVAITTDSYLEVSIDGVIWWLGADKQ